MTNKVRVGKQYIYSPNLLDRTDGRINLKDGDVVTVVNLHGCPRANTMGHCHVNLRVPKRFYTIVARGQHGAYSLQVQRATLKNALRYAQILFPSRDGFWDWEAIECRCWNNEDLCEACEVYETYRGVKQ